MLRYIPFVQANFMIGLDCDEGPEPFELTKKFLDLAPGAYPAFSLLTAYGRAAPYNLDLQAEGRVRPVPFHFLNSTRGMNVKPKNYAWPEFFGYLADLVGNAHSPSRIFRRFCATSGTHGRWLNVLRAATSKKVDYYRDLQGLLGEGEPLRDFFDGGTLALPEFFTRKIRNDLGPFWELLPDGAMMHDHLAYLNAEQSREAAEGRRAASSSGAHHLFQRQTEKGRPPAPGKIQGDPGQGR